MAAPSGAALANALLGGNTPTTPPAVPAVTAAASGSAPSGAALANALLNGTPAGTATAPTGHGGGNVATRFLHGAENTVTGLIPGTIHLVNEERKALQATIQHPWVSGRSDPNYEGNKSGVDQLVADVGRAYKDKYLSRDVLHNIWQDPFGTTIDALTLGSAGLGRAFALKTLPEGGSALKAAATGKYQGPLRTIEVQGNLGAPVTVRTLPRQGARAARMTATDKLLKRLTPETPGLGEHARAARAVNASALTKQLRHRASDAYVNQQRAWGRLSARERVALNVLNRVPLAHDLEAWRASLPTDDLAARKLAAQLDDPKVRALYDEPSAKMLAAHEAATVAAEYQTRLQIANGGLSAATAAAAPYRHVQFARGAKLEDGVRVGGGTPEEIRAEIEAAGRPQPYFAPDKMASKRGQYVGGKSGGRTPPPTLIHQSEGTLFNKGLVALHIDTQGPSFLRAAMRDAAIDKHEQVLKVAVPAPDNKLAHGYRWVRTRRGQRIPFTATQHGEHVHDIDETLPGFGENGLTSTEPDLHGDEIATDAKGQRLMVPEHFAKVLEGDLTVQRSVLAKIDHRLLQVWRALILNLRVPWLENNVFGNTILAAIRFAGPNGLVAVLGMIRETKGLKAARRALRLAESNGKHLDDALLREKLPELSRGGTFIGSQLPTGLAAKLPAPLQQTGKAVGNAVGFLPRIDRATEGALRRASAETVLRGSEEVRAIYQAMPEQTRTWHQAMSKGLDDPDLRRLVVREVNDAMGNFLSLTPAEAGAVRSLIPFYAWFREITRIATKLPVDAPGRTLLLEQLGQIGAQNNTLGPLPHYLEGSIPLGHPQGDMQEILNLRGANPLTSAVDVLSGRNPVGELNPFVGAAVKYLGSGDLTNPASLYSLPRQVGQQVTESLPEVRVGTNPPSRLYPGRTREQLLEQFFGDLRRHISLQQAHYNASQGQ